MLDGHQPANLTLKKLTRRRLPLDWAEQRIQFGFPAGARGQRIDSLTLANLAARCRRFRFSICLRPKSK
jgi:hypothetical protein